MDSVILVHGLWVPGLAMLPLAARLGAAGFRCRTFSYFGAARPIEAHAERLARFAQDLQDAGGPAHFVGHSLGGLVVLEALSRHRQVAAGRVLLLGTPARGCAAGRRLARWPGGRWFLGRSESLWRSDREARWTRPEPLGVIAGSLPVGLGRMLGGAHGASAVSDGVVAYDETAVDGMRERLLLRVAHSQMLVSRRVAAQAAAFLAHGRFDADPR
jgi:pimeloyl-ACP methyl ester carboxylesterase